MFSEVIKEYWHIIVGVGVFMAGYGKLNERVEKTREDMNIMESRVNARRTEDIGRIETMMTEIRADVKALLKRGAQ